MVKNFLFVLSLFLFNCGDYDFAAEKSIPSLFFWSSVDLDDDGILENYVSPTKNQGGCGDCYIYAAVGLLEMQYKIDHRVQINLDLSEQYLHNCLKLHCEHSYYIDKTLEYIQFYGIVEEYMVALNNWSKCINCKDYFDASNGESFYTSEIPFFTFDGFEAYSRAEFDDEEDVKLELVKKLLVGPVAVLVRHWGSFEKNSDGELECKKKAPVSQGHAVILVGYENFGEYFFIKNSHGENRIIKLKFKNSSACGFADSFYQIKPGSTRIIAGLGKEYCHSKEDRDGDLYLNAFDNCPWTPNVEQIDTDGDGFGDICDPCPNDYNGKTGFYCDEK